MLASTQFPPRVICCGVTITQREAFFIKHSPSWGWCCSLRHVNLFGPWATSAAPPSGPPPSTFLMVLGMGCNNHHATPTVAGSQPSLQHHHLSFSLEPEASWLIGCGDRGEVGWLWEGRLSLQGLHSCRWAWVLSKDIHLLELLKVLLTHAGRVGVRWGPSCHGILLPEGRGQEGFGAIELCSDGWSREACSLGSEGWLKYSPCLPLAG